MDSVGDTYSGRSWGWSPDDKLHCGVRTRHSDREVPNRIVRHGVMRLERGDCASASAVCKALEVIRGSDWFCREDVCSDMPDLCSGTGSPDLAEVLVPSVHLGHLELFDATCSHAPGISSTS